MVTVLLADDDVDARQLLVGLLHREGYAVTVAADGEALLEAYATLTRAGHPPRVIVTDIDMPRRDGVAAIRALRADDVDVPAVFITGKTDEALLAQARTVGDGLLTKPVDIAELMARVGALAGVSSG